MDDDDRFVKDLFARRKAEQAAKLKTAKEEAAQRGKEPFDLDRFETLFTPFKYGRYLPSREERLKDWEARYYTYHPDIMTLEEFAKEMAEQEKWGVFD